MRMFKSIFMKGAVTSLFGGVFAVFGGASPASATEEAWLEAKGTDTAEAYTSFIVQNPTSEYVTQALCALSEITGTRVGFVASGLGVGGVDRDLAICVGDAGTGDARIVNI